MSDERSEFEVDYFLNPCNLIRPDKSNNNKEKRVFVVCRSFGLCLASQEPLQ